MSGLRPFEVHLPLCFRVLASSEEDAVRAVAEELCTPIADAVERLHETNARLAGWRVHGDGFVQEIEP